MQGFIKVLYLLVLGLWLGGVALFSFVVTPTVFTSFEGPRAGEVVSALFPNYYLSGNILGLLLVILSLVMFRWVPLSRWCVERCDSHCWVNAGSQLVCGCCCLSSGT